MMEFQKHKKFNFYNFGDRSFLHICIEFLSIRIGRNLYINVIRGARLSLFSDSKLANVTVVGYRSASQDFFRLIATVCFVTRFSNVSIIVVYAVRLKI